MQINVFFFLQSHIAHIQGNTGWNRLLSRKLKQKQDLTNNTFEYCNTVVAESYQLYVPELAAVGKTVGRIRASDEDEGQNAEMTYSITNADAAAIFAITTDDDGREGIISLKQVGNTT